MPALLNYSQAAEYLGMSESRLRRAVTERRITCVKASGKTGPTQFRPEDLDHFVTTCLQPAENGPAAEATAKRKR